MPRAAALKTVSLAFDGHILNRGFWIYVWSIRFGRKRYLYVGRTGDSSSVNAASPFSRVGAHLNLKGTAKSNSLARHIDHQGLDPAQCHYQLFAIGPLFPEQASRKRHLRFRDDAAAVERALVDDLREKGFTVLGNHPQQRPVEPRFMRRITLLVDRFLGLRSSRGA